MSVLPVGMGSSGGYQIPRSLRLRSSASAYLSRTPGSAGNRKTWTWSGWVKRGSLGTQMYLLGAGATAAEYTMLRFTTGNSLEYARVVASGIDAQKISTAFYRDPSAWMHIVCVEDAANTVARIYVNGEEVAYSTNDNPSNVNAAVNNSAVAHRLADGVSGVGTGPFDGYLSEINFIDGQALTPSSFGETSATTGQWQAKKYTGTYGTNGFYLPFTDTTSTTTLCYDASGNGNNWTATNVSLTVGATYDSMTDVPLGGGGSLGNGQGNYATLSPVGVPFSNGTLADGNLKFTALTTTDKGSAATISIRDVVTKWEATKLSGTASNIYAGVILTGASSDVNANRVYLRGDGQVYRYGTALGAVGPTLADGDVVGLVYDPSAATLAIYKNGTLSYTVTGLNAAEHTPWVGGYTTTESWAVNFGQRPFAYPPPTGFKALHTGNLTSDTVTTSGTFTGNVSTDGPFIWCNGTPETLTINGNAVTFGTHADRLANGFKLRTASTSYNASGSNTWTATVLSPSSKSAFRAQNAKGNP